MFNVDTLHLDIFLTVDVAYLIIELSCVLVLRLLLKLNFYIVAAKIHSYDIESATDY